MNKLQLREIHKQLTELRRVQQLPPNKREASTVRYLQSELAKDPAGPMQTHLLALLANEYGYLGLKEDEEEVLQQLIDLDPVEPMPRIALATFLRLEPDRLEEARSAAKLAIEYAETTGRFRRHALQTLARIAKERRDYAELATALQSLVALRVTNGVADSAVENDFLVGLPDGVIDASLLENVRARK